ncbi:MAG: hypothetical protein LUD01_08930 [Clostridiales bacterium]|nr:hypothetical protein [Clostridiales bacterium]
MEKCRTLQEYMILVSRIRHYSETLPLANAVEEAVNECIRENILADFLRKNKSEVIRVGIFEYDEEKHMRQIREEGRASKLTELISYHRAKGLSTEEIADILMETPEQILELEESEIT